MKHVDFFNAFMKGTVDLNQARIKVLEARVRAIEGFLGDADYGASIQRFRPQGSWAHKTIIKPANGGEFDADLMMFVTPQGGWKPRDYVENLYRIFRQNSRYRGVVKQGTRCVTLDYAGDFHLDVVPCLERWDFWGGTTFHVVNRLTNREEETASDEFVAWLMKRNDITGRNMLRKVIRVMKYQRDIKRTFSAKSILLTTLIGMQVSNWDSWQPILGESTYPDLPTALKVLVGRLDDWLQEREVMPVVINPVLKYENFNRHWDQTKYANFRKLIGSYRRQIDDAYAEKSYPESLRKWKGVLGDNFAKSKKVSPRRNTGSRA